MSTSHYSRPVTHDRVLSAWLTNPDNPRNQSRRRHIYAAIWMAAGAVLLLLDVAAIRWFATDALESLILAALTMPTGLFVLVAALEARK